jgi:hypothetical protein
MHASIDSIILFVPWFEVLLVFFCIVAVLLLRHGGQGYHTSRKPTHAIGSHTLESQQQEEPYKKETKNRDARSQESPDIVFPIFFALIHQHDNVRSVPKSRGPVHKLDRPGILEDIVMEFLRKLRLDGTRHDSIFELLSVTPNPQMKDGMCFFLATLKLRTEKKCKIMSVVGKKFAEVYPIFIVVCIGEES